jgi:hypothetical protein
MPRVATWIVPLVSALAAWCGPAVQAQPHDAPWAPVNRFERPVLLLPLSARSHLVFQPPESRRWDTLPGLSPEPRRSSVGFEFEAGRRGSAWPRQVLRVQLSSQEWVQFRPRGGGLMISYRAHFCAGFSTRRC